MSLTAVGFVGTSANRREAGRVLLGAVLITAVLAALTTSLAARPSWLELVGTSTGLCNVWLLRKQNVVAWFFGIVSVTAVGLVFYRLGLMGQAWLHLFYFLPINWWAWYHWVRGGEQHTEFRVSWTSRKEWLVYVPFFVVGTYLVASFFDRVYDRAIFVYWDATIVAASVIAQWLLSRKKIESWILWVGPVDASAIVLFSLTGAHMFSALYIIFLLNASAAIYEWREDWRVHGAPYATQAR